MKPVPISGLGCICAAGNSVPECSQSMFSSERAEPEYSRLKTSHEVRYPVFEVPEHPLVDRPGQAQLLRASRLALVAVSEALQNAGWSESELARARVGVVLGTTVGCSMNNEDFNSAYRRGERPSMEAIDRYLSSNPADVIARRYDLTGPRLTVNNACTSGTDAIAIAATWIRSGVCDVVITGGADDLCRVVYSGFVSLLNCDQKPCRPFDRERAGLNLGEGAGILILERQPRVEAKAMVVGYGSACDAYHLTAPRPDGAGLRRAMNQALEKAGVSPDQVAFVNAHGTGTTNNDLVEAVAIHDLLGATPYLSTKGLTGHTLGAAGGIEAVFTIECLRQGRVPASMGFRHPDPEIELSPVDRVTTVGSGVALSQSLAFGGNNSVIALAVSA